MGIIKKINTGILYYFALSVSFFINFSLLKKIVDIKIKRNKGFQFKDNNLKYFFHSYNNFYLTERVIEIPIIEYFLKEKKYERILEIGNVTKHYYDNFRIFQHKDTLDKFENAYDVINMDIKDYKPDHKYNFIYSISTFEHMDSDGGRNPHYEKINNGSYSSIAFKNMDYVIKNMLAKDGRFIVTFPLDYLNAEIDQSIFNHDEKHFNISQMNLFVYLRTGSSSWKAIDLKNIKYKKRKSVYLLCVLEIIK